MYNEASAGAYSVGRDPLHHPEVDRVMFTLFNPYPEAADHLAKLFGREYFERVWCIQEVVVFMRFLIKCEELEMRYLQAALHCYVHWRTTWNHFSALKLCNFGLRSFNRNFGAWYLSGDGRSKAR